MAAHGFTRETRDIDVFVSPDSREETLQLCGELGLPLEQIFAETHYAYIPDASDPDQRIDLLFPHSRPDITAVVFPVRRQLRGVEYPIWDLHLIAVQSYKATETKT